MTPQREDLLAEIRARAMSDEGLSDAEAAAYQARQAALMDIADRDGGAEAIRAAVRPKPKQKRAQQGDVRKAEPSKLEQMLTGRPTAVPASTAMRGMPMANPLRQAAQAKAEAAIPAQLEAMREDMAAQKAVEALAGRQMAPAPQAPQNQMGMIAKLMQLLGLGGQGAAPATMQAPAQPMPAQRWGGPQPGGVGQAASFLGKPM